MFKVGDVVRLTGKESSHKDTLMGIAKKTVFLSVDYTIEKIHNNDALLVNRKYQQSWWVGLDGIVLAKDKKQVWPSWL